MLHNSFKIYPTLLLKNKFIWVAIVAGLIVTGCKQQQGDYIRQSLLDSLTKINPAIGNISAQIKKNPGRAELYFSRGSLFLQMHQLALAAADLHKSIEIDSTKVPYYLTFADINIEAHYVPLAMDYLRRAKKVAPDDRELSIKLAKTYLYLKEYDAAIAETNNVLAVDNTNAKCLLLQGLVYKEKGDTAKALATFRQAANAEPNNYGVYMQLGLLTNYRNKKLAEKYLQNAIRIDSSKFEANYALAMYYQNNNDLKKAIAQYKKMIVSNPQEAQALYNIGCIYFHMDSLEKAFINFNLAVLNAPANADAYYMRGLCWEHRRNKTEAAKDFQNALNLRSNFDDATEGLKRVSK